ncbi:MAG: FecR family protein [Prosthecobacter sp.]|uniref:FecR family protein n=1 Tax=Prosthecobacter sp. TaxID=1965333 RepID=UPI0038FFE7E5
MNDDLLIQRCLDGALTPAAQVEVNQRLRDDAALRDQLREIAEQAVVMGDLGRESVLNRRAWTSAEVGLRKSSSLRPSMLGGFIHRMALAASIALLAASAWFWNGRRAAPVLTLMDSSGSIAWSQGGTLRQSVADGETLSAGTIETVGESATALLQFHDGTLLTLSGDSELSFSEEGQKLLVLRKGSLSAQVKPQPKDRPMLVRTASAEAQVVGTVFNLAARTDDTLLNVEEGLVKLKRLADGSSIDVPAKSSAVASLDSALKLDSTTTPEPLTGWSFDFTTNKAPRDWRGVSDGTRIVASPYVAARKSSGAIITHFGISVRTALLTPPLALMATERSVIRYRLRLREAADLQVMLLTNEVAGGFGGNFECHIHKDELKPGPDGWCELVIPISRYEPIDHRAHIRDRQPTAAGNIITSAIISTFRRDFDLAVARFDLVSRP